MKNTELVTLIISSAALLVSFGALYLQFFHKRTAILGRLIGINYKPHDDNYERVLNYSISNLGNQEILLNDVEFLEGQSARGRAHEGYAVHEYKCIDSPYVLKPGEIKLFEVFTKKKESKRKTKYEKKYFIMLCFTSTEGKNLEIFHDITRSGSINSKEEKAVWEPFTLKDATE